MKHLLLFLKLNGLSLGYALAFFLHSELSVNIYRIERIAGHQLANSTIALLILLIYVVFSILLYFLTKRLIGTSAWKYAICLLWIPYYGAMIRIFASLYPLTDPQERPLGGVGILLLGFFLLYPFYIALINFVASLDSEKASCP